MTSQNMAKQNCLQMIYTQSSVQNRWLKLNLKRFMYQARVHILQCVACEAYCK